MPLSSSTAHLCAMAWYVGCDYVACSHCQGARRGGAGLRFVANAYSSASGDELEVPPIHSLKAKMFAFAMPGVWIALDITVH
ncbi:hypothetical protein C8R45DRAFT_1110502 [Mycena sanguinolenta]|nr:hypothetical protein C8R45DRAFT_1110502 [Mycena sanguinolenta]